MKKYIFHFLIFLCPLVWLAPASAQNSHGVLLMLPAIIAASRYEPPPPPPVEPAPPTVTWQGREWQQSDDGVPYNWRAAMEYCENLVLDGHSDWILPTKTELKGLVVCTNGTPTPLQDFPDAEPWNCGDDPNDSVDGFRSPTIDVSFSCRSSDYWTSTLKNSNYAHRVNFYRGGAGSGEAIAKFYVRCVR